MSRTKVLRYCLVGMMAVMAVRLFVVQIVEHEMWMAKADEKHIMRNKIVAKRGEIYAMDGAEPTALVMNESVWTVLVDPKEANEKKTKKVIEQYAGEQVVADWNKVFENRELRYFVVAKNVPREKVIKIKQAGLRGVWFQDGVRRVYPEGELASSVLGFVNAEGEGQYGVEGAMNKALKGEDGLLKTVKDVNNVALSIGEDNVRVPAKNGKKVVLSIDKNVQYETERILKDNMQRVGASHASAVVMNPKNGQIWAIANMPGYNPGEYMKVKSAEQFQNNVLEDAYEPASVCKVFTFAVGIEEGAMTPNKTYENNGFVVVDGWKINNAYTGMLGVIDMQTALDYSLNTGSTQVLRWLGGSGVQITQKGKDALYDYYHGKFGLGEYTGVELYESKGIVVAPDKVDGTDARYANMTFGQGLNATMMQVVTGFASIVNGGEYYQPTIVAGEMVDGKLVPAEAKKAVRRTVSEATSLMMRKMLYGVRKGRRLAGVDREGYFVGGKTGTAQVIKDGKYVMSETVASYVGFGGAGNDGTELPEYVIMVKIWEEGRRIEGERDALPIFDAMSNYMQKYLRIKPERN